MYSETYSVDLRVVIERLHNALQSARAPQVLSVARADEVLLGRRQVAVPQEHVMSDVQQERACRVEFGHERRHLQRHDVVLADVGFVQLEQTSWLVLASHVTHPEAVLLEVAVEVPAKGHTMRRLCNIHESGEKNTNVIGLKLDLNCSDSRPCTSRYTTQSRCRNESNISTHARAER